MLEDTVGLSWKTDFEHNIFINSLNILSTHMLLGVVWQQNGKSMLPTLKEPTVHRMDRRVQWQQCDWAWDPVRWELLQNMPINKMSGNFFNKSSAGPQIHIFYLFYKFLGMLSKSQPQVTFLWVHEQGNRFQTYFWENHSAVKCCAVKLASCQLRPL